MPQYQIDKSGKRVEPGDAGYDWSQGSTQFDPLADAKGFLADPANRVPQPSQEDTDYAFNATNVPKQPMSLRGLTDIMESTSLPLAGMGMIPSPASPFLLGASGAMSAAGGLRKMIAPEEDESRTEGGVQSALSLLPFAGKLKNIGQLAMRKFPESVEKAYRMGAPTAMSGLNEAQPSLRALEEMAAATKVPAVKASQTAGLPESWKQFAKPEGWEPTFAKKAKVVHTKAGVKSRLARMNQESEAGYRNVPTSDAQRADPTAGLGGITPAEWAKLGLRQTRQTMPRRMSEQGWGEDLFDQLSQREGRLSVPARARAFREQK